MPVIPNPDIHDTTPKATPPDVLDPTKYRFGGYVFERDERDNIIRRIQQITQPAIWSQRGIRFSRKWDLR